MIHTIHQTVLNIFKEHLSIEADQIRDDSLLVEDLGLDSMDTVALLIALDEHFHIKLPAEEVSQIKTFGELMAWVSKAVGSA